MGVVLSWCDGYKNWPRLELKMEGLLMGLEQEHSFVAQIHIEGVKNQSPTVLISA
jgi:hypothetical protein